MTKIPTWARRQIGFIIAWAIVSQLAVLYGGIWVFLSLAMTVPLILMFMKLARFLR